MNLKNLKNEILVQNTKNLIKEENRILAKVLEHFLEIDSRKLNLLQEEPISAAEAETKLRGYFKLENKKRVVKIEMDAETYELWLETKAKLGESKEAVALKKLCESQVEKKQTKVRQAPSTRTAGVVLRRELLKRPKHRCENRHFLQCDHKVPYFLGGKTAQQNMRVLCQQHNVLVYQNLKGQNIF